MQRFRIASPTCQELARSDEAETDSLGFYLGSPESRSRTPSAGGQALAVPTSPGSADWAPSADDWMLRRAVELKSRADNIWDNVERVSGSRGFVHNERFAVVGRQQGVH